MLDEKTRRDMEARLETLKQYRNRIETNNETIKDLVRRDVSKPIVQISYNEPTNF